MSKTYIPAPLRRSVRARANECCEYCGISESAVFATHEVEHIVAEKHRGVTGEENLALSCSVCNKHKGSDLTSIDPETGETVRLFHPREDHWIDHFELKDSGEVVPLTAKGRVTALLLQINREDRLEERELLLRAGKYSAPVS